MRKMKVYFGSLCMIIMMMLMSTSAYAATLKSVTVNKNRTYKWDMTHDGKADSVKFTFTKDRHNSGCCKKLQISVNGKKAYSASNLWAYEFQVQYIKISKTKEFLYIVGRGDSNYPCIRKIFRYDTASKKLVEAADLSKYTGTVWGIKKVSGNNLTISYTCGPSSVGRIKWNYIYEYNSAKKKFVLKSSTAAVKCAVSNYDPGDGYTSYFKKNMYKTAKSITAYNNKLCTQKAFVIPAGKWLIMKKIYVNKSGKMNIQFKYGTKTIWIPCDKNGSPYFEGINKRLAGGFYG